MSADGKGADLDWCDILNWETMGQFLDDGGWLAHQVPSSTLYGRREWETELGVPNWTFPPGMLMCPNFDREFKNADGLSLYPYAYNHDAAGGMGLGPLGSFPPDQYGVIAPPGTAPGGPYYGYSYGANLGRFRPDEFLLVENEQQTGETLVYPNLVGTKHAVTLNDSSELPSYSGEGGYFSFRHPYTKMANFLYFDGHVSMLSPKDDINDVRMLSMPGSYPGTE
jgi:prepilin-type processing-associated H-X9-DG protein